MSGRRDGEEHQRGGGHEGREVDGLKERQKTRTSCVIGKASD